MLIIFDNIGLKFFSFVRMKNNFKNKIIIFSLKVKAIYNIFLNASM